MGYLNSLEGGGCDLDLCLIELYIFEVPKPGVYGWLLGVGDVREKLYRPHSPKKGPLEKEKHLQITNFLGSMLVLFWGVYLNEIHVGLDFPALRDLSSLKCIGFSRECFPSTPAGSLSST